MRDQVVDNVLFVMEVEIKGSLGDTRAVRNI
jgi:hypothetical protein